MATLGAPIQFSHGPAPASSPAASRLFVSPLSPPLTSYAPSSTFIASRFSNPNVLNASSKLQSIIGASNNGGLPLDLYNSSDSTPRTMPTPPLATVTPPLKGRLRGRTSSQHQQEESQSEQPEQIESRTSLSKRKRSSATLGEDDAEPTTFGLQTPFNLLSEFDVNKSGIKRRRSDEAGSSCTVTNTQTSDATQPDTSPSKRPKEEDEAKKSVHEARRSSAATWATRPRESIRFNPTTPPNQDPVPQSNLKTPNHGLAPECVPDGLERRDFYASAPPKKPSELRDFDHPWTNDEDRLLIDIVISNINLTDEQLATCSMQLGRAHPDQVADRLRRLVNFGCIGLKRPLGNQHDRRRTIPSNFWSAENTGPPRRRRPARHSTTN